MAKGTLNREDRIDDRYRDRFNHPENSDSARLSSDEASKLRDIEENYGKDGVEPDYQRDNNRQSATDSARDAESNSSWKNSYSGSNTTSTIKSKFTGKKKKGPLALILGLVFGGGAGFSFLLSPGLGIVHMKEILTNDLNDQLAAIDIRQDSMLRGKLKKISSGVCGTKVSIRCKFSSMNKRQIERFRKAGFEVETRKAGTGLMRREKITSMKHIDSGSTFRNPSDLMRSKNPAVRSAVYKGFPTKFSFLSDKVAMTKGFAHFGIDKARKITGADDKARAQSVDDKIKMGETSTDNKRPVMKEGDKEYVMDDDGKKVYSYDDNYDKVKDKAPNDKISKALDEKTEGKSLAKNVAKGAGKGAAKGLMVTGAADTACSVYNMFRAVSAMSKIIRATQLANYASIFLTTADEIKAGDADPEEVEYVGKILMSPDMQEMVRNEDNIEPSKKDGKFAVDVKETKNPDYRKNAFDSAGYQTAAYNDAPVLNARAQNYMVGGGLTGTLASVPHAVADVIGTTEEGISDKCGKIQNWWVRGGSLILGLVVGVGSFGLVPALMIGASIAIGMAMPFLVAQLADMIAGTVVDSDTKGIDSGNAIFSGTSSLLGRIAQARGMKPGNKEDLAAYQQVKNQVNSKLIAIERYDARSEPFNVYNQYSMIGSFTRTLIPMAHKFRNDPVTAMISTPNLILSGVKNSTPLAGAFEGTFNKTRFSRCNDPGYKALKIDADVFCNVRYAMSKEELSIDPDENVKWMVDQKHVDEETGEAKSKAYEKFLESCVDRMDGWGESSEEDGDPDVGKDCMKNDDKTSRFRVYTMDFSIDQAMEDGPVSGAVSADGVSESSNNGDLPSGAAKELAQQVVDSPNFSSDAKYTKQIQDVADGKSDCNVNPTILSLLVAILKDYKITVSSLNRRCTGVMAGAGSGSKHFIDGGGHAVDISIVDGTASTGGTANDKKLINSIKGKLPSGSGIGQKECRSGVSLPSGIREFTDNCDHIHIDVPVKQM